MLRRFVISASLACLGGAAFGQNNPSVCQFWLGRALVDAAGLSDPTEKAGVETTIAGQYASADDTRGAAAALAAASADALRISDPQAQFRALMNLATAHDQADDGKASTALFFAGKAAESLPAGPQRDAANQQLANLLGVISGFGAASRTINAVTDPAQRSIEFADLAATYAGSSRRHQQQDYPLAIAAAHAAADAISDPIAKHMMLAKLVQTRVGVGDMDGAKDEAALVANPTAQGLAFAALAGEYLSEGKLPEARDAIAQMQTAAGGASDDRRTAIWLDVAHARQALGDSAQAKTALDNAIRYAQHLQPADKADALSGAAQVDADLTDMTAAASAIAGATEATRAVVDQGDLCEVMMTLAAAQARCGMGSAAKSSIAQAQAAGAAVPPDKRNPDGEPPPQAYIAVIQAAADAQDFPTAQAIADSVNDRHVKHDAALAIASAQINLGQYQPAEDTVAREGSLDTEAAACGMIASSLARTRGPAIAETWVERLTNASDKVAARLAVAEIEPPGTPTTMPAAK